MQMRYIFVFMMFMIFHISYCIKVLHEMSQNRCAFSVQPVTDVLDVVNISTAGMPRNLCFSVGVSNPIALEASPTPSSRPPTSASGMFYQEPPQKRSMRSRVTDVACFPASLDEGGGCEDNDNFFVDGGYTNDCTCES